MKKIEDYSWGYELVHKLVWLVHRFEYGKFIVNGINDVPKDKPIIFAANHQNALMDAMVLVTTSKRQVVFLTRADIFKGKLVKKILAFLKMIPVFRIRDGKDSLQKNDETFDTTFRILKKKKWLCLFPEAQHIGMRSMLPHKKAIPRIVFMVGEKTNFELDVQIVPVGIYYSHYYDYRKSLIVNYGKPISVLPFYKIYQEKGEHAATVALKDEIFKSLSNITVNVPDKDNYAVYDEFFDLHRSKVLDILKLKHRTKHTIKADQFLTEKLSARFANDPQVLTDKAKEVESFRELKTKLNISTKALVLGRLSFFSALATFILLLITLPLAIAGAAINGLPFWYTHYPHRKKLKDPQFWSSFAFALSLFVFPIFYLIVAVLIGVFSGNWIVALISIIAMPILGVFAWDYLQIIKRFAERFRFTFYAKRCADMKNLLSQYNSFDKFLNEVCK